MAHFTSLKCDDCFQGTLICYSDLNTDRTVCKCAVPQTVEKRSPSFGPLDLDVVSFESNATVGVHWLYAFGNNICPLKISELILRLSFPKVTPGLAINKKKTWMSWQCVSKKEVSICITVLRCSVTVASVLWGQKQYIYIYKYMGVCDDTNNRKRQKWKEKSSML